jgi:hypothetical protein
VLAILLIFYVRYQARNMLQGPVISLSGDTQTIQDTRLITLSGEAHNIVKLTLNGHEIHTTESGVFNQTLVLEEGYTIIELNAQDRFGRTATLKREYVYAPQLPDNSNT